MAVPVVEQETVVSIMRHDKRAIVYTSDTVKMCKFDKLVQSSDEWRLESTSTIRGEIAGKTYSCPVNLISFRNHTRGKKKTAT